jgi:predicted permease
MLSNRRQLGYGAVVDPALVLVFVMLGLGYGLRRTGVFVESAADAFNRYVLYVCLPAVVLLLVPKLSWHQDVLLLVVTPWVMLLVGACCVALVARLLHWPRAVLGALLLCAAIGNTSFVGIPIIAALRGSEAVHYALLYDQFGSFLILSTYGTLVVARMSGGPVPGPGAIALRVLKFPPFIALVLAFVPLQHPPLLDAVLQRIADTLAPVAVFAVGLRLKLRPPEQRSALFVGLATKMLICPLLVLLAFRLANVHGLPAEVAVLEAGMPSSVTAGAMASLAGLAPELCAALVGYGVLIAFVSEPLLAACF